MESVARFPRVPFSVPSLSQTRPPPGTVGSMGCAVQTRVVLWGARRLQSAFGSANDLVPMFQLRDDRLPDIIELLNCDKVFLKQSFCKPHAVHQLRSSKGAIAMAER